jgi:hypothetical protein
MRNNFAELDNFIAKCQGGLMYQKSLLGYIAATVYFGRSVRTLSGQEQKVMDWLLTNKLPSRILSMLRTLVSINLTFFFSFFFVFLFFLFVMLVHFYSFQVLYYCHLALVIF